MLPTGAASWVICLSLQFNPCPEELIASERRMVGWDLGTVASSWLFELDQLWGQVWLWVPDKTVEITSLPKYWSWEGGFASERLCSLAYSACRDSDCPVCVWSCLTIMSKIQTNVRDCDGVDLECPPCETAKWSAQLGLLRGGGHWDKGTLGGHQGCVLEGD